MSILDVINNWFKSKFSNSFVKVDYSPPTDNDVLGRYVVNIMSKDWSGDFVETRVGTYYHEIDMALSLQAFYKGLSIGFITSARM